MKTFTRLMFAVASLLVSLMVMLTDEVQAQERLKVGIIGQFSGPFATSGQEYRQGIESYVALHGTSAGGREIELVYRDVGGSNPAVAKRLAEELIVQDK